MLSNNINDFDASSLCSYHSCIQPIEENTVKKLIPIDLHKIFVDKNIDTLSAEHDLDENININDYIFNTVKRESPIMVYPKEINIILTETDTHFLFELPCKTVDKNSEEGPLVEEDNEKYIYLSRGKGRNRKTVNDETQTEECIMRMRFTTTPTVEMKNSYAFASKWDMFDSFAEKKNTNRQYRFGKTRSIPSSEIEDVITNSLICLETSPSLFNLTIIMERVLANNVFKTKHDYYKNIIDDESIEARLHHLWSFRCKEVKNLAVTEICWNMKNNDILGISYGKYFYTDETNGYVAIWSIKNPMHPERFYEFTSPVTCMEFSVKNPNLLAIGFYNGNVAIIDVTSREKKIITENDRSIFPSYGPIWQIRWYHSIMGQELISVGDDSIIYQYEFKKTKKLIKNQIMKIINVEDYEIHKSTKEDLPITKTLSSLVLCFHPSKQDNYFVGTSSGHIYTCSMNNMYQYLNVFLAHDGPVYNIEFSRWNTNIFLTCGADWVVKLWALGLNENLVTLKTRNPIVYASFCPTHPTIVAAINSKNIYLWDLKNTYKTLLIKMKIDHAYQQFTKMKFTIDGRNLLTGDIKGGVHVYNLSSILKNKDEDNLNSAIEKILLKKPDLSKKYCKLYNT